MRLIDADALKDILLKHGYTTEHNQIFKYIDEQPTAYDIGKVVTELNELDVTAIKRYEGGTFGNYEGTDYYIKQSDAIEIVKQCGVDVANNATTKNDDVCEWKAIGANDNWSTSCDKNSTHNVFGVAWFKRCPYCGRKLKIVGDNDDD